MSTDVTDDFIAAAARALAIAIEPEWMPTVKEHLGVTLRHAKTVAEFDLPEELEPAPVFVA